MKDFQDVLGVISFQHNVCNSNGKKRFEVPGALDTKRVPSRRAKCGQPNQVLAMLKRTGR